MSEKKFSKVILIYNSVSYFLPFFSSKGIEAYPAYRDFNAPLNILKKMCKRLKIFRSIWFDEWKNSVKNAELVIFFSTNPIESLFFIKKVNPKVRVVFWYWNPVKNSHIQPAQVPDVIAEKWSFDIEDCKKFGMRYNTSFYFNNITISNPIPNNDIVFVGVDKGRRDALLTLQKKLNLLQIATFFYIVDDKWNTRGYSGKIKPVSYECYLHKVSQSRAILDYIQEGQNGLTLRPLESIFLKKKLITNDLSILEQDFYEPNNIFILGRDSLENIHHFVNTPYKPLPSELVNKYDVEKWLGRFISRT